MPSQLYFKKKHQAQKKDTFPRSIPGGPLALGSYQCPKKNLEYSLYLQAKIVLQEYR